MFREGASNTLVSPSRVGTSRPQPGTPRDLVKVMLAAAARLARRPHLKSARTLLARSGEELATMLDPERRPDWAWFEIVFEDDACRLPAALLRAGRALGRDDFVERGTETLEWMLRGRVLGRCQSALRDACEAAFAATGDMHWLSIAARLQRLD